MNSFRAAYFMVIGMALTSAAMPAQAGFQWVPGQNQAASPSATPSLVSPSGEFTGNGASYMPDPVAAEPLANPPAPMATQPEVSAPTPMLAEDEILMPLPAETAPTAQPASNPQPIQTITNSETAGTQPHRTQAVASNGGPTFQWMGQGETPVERGWNSRTVDQQFQPAPAVVPTPATASVNPQQNFTIVEGFGNDLPMVLALPQIVPAEYSYSFGSGVNPGAIVSWNGGKEWNHVLQDMVAPLGLSIEITDRTVRFEKSLQYAPASRQTMNTLPAQDNSYADSAQRRNITDPGQGRMIPAASETYKAPAQDNIRVTMSAPNEPMTLTPPPANNYAVQPETTIPAAAEEEDVSWVESLSQKMAKIGDDFRSGNKVEPTETRMWEAQKGDSLKNTLVEWSKSANINLVWNSSRDYTVNSNIMVNGTFNNAVKTVFTEGLAGEQKPNLKFVDNPNSSQSTTFIVSDNG